MYVNSLHVSVGVTCAAIIVDKTWTRWFIVLTQKAQHGTAFGPFLTWPDEWCDGTKTKRKPLEFVPFS